MGKREKIRVPCDVISNPSVDLKFEWVFNSSSERLDLQVRYFEKKHDYFFKKKIYLLRFL